MKEILEAAAKHPGYIKDGKKFLAVKDRVKIFREFYSETMSICTEVLKHGREIGDAIVVKASVVGPNLQVIATGHAEEIRGEGAFNSVAALECAETKAVGRALAFLGIAGGELASHDELAAALHPRRNTGGADEMAISPRAELEGGLDVPTMPGMVDGGLKDMVDVGPDATLALGDGTSTSKVAKDLEHKLEAWPDIAAYLKMATSKQPTLGDLEQLYRLNRPLIDEMKKASESNHKSLLGAFASRKAELATTKEEKEDGSLSV